MKARVVTFGEIMMRLSTQGQARLKQANAFNVLYAGSEANVAAALANWGVPAAHVTTLPDNDFGQAVINELRQYGVDMSYCVFQEGRLGVYFLEHGASLRASKIVYDRFDSAFAELDPKSFKWEEILAGATWFHWSGITPAVSEDAATACLDAIRVARKMGITISGDINYRRNLWQYGKTALDIMPELIAHCDVIVAGVTDFENCCGIADKTFAGTCAEAVKKYPNIKTVISTDRETISATFNKLTGLLWTPQHLLMSPTFDLNPIVDRIGGGDAFMAGYIYAQLAGFDSQTTVNFATAASSMKHAIEGDVLVASLVEIKALMAGENVGKLLR